MTTADWAIIISIGALSISFMGFVWNVWSKFIYPKPKLQVSMSKMAFIAQGKEASKPCIAIHATNFGPSQVTLRNVIARGQKRMPTRKFSLGILNPYNAYPHDLNTNGPFSGGLPKKLDVGEEFSTFFPATSEWFEIEKLVKFGYLDTFGRYHWCKSKNVRRVKEEVLQSLDSK